MASCCSLLNPFLASSLQLPMMWIPTRTILSTLKMLMTWNLNSLGKSKSNSQTKLLPIMWIPTRTILSTYWCFAQQILRKGSLENKMLLWCVFIHVYIAHRIDENLQHLHRQILCSRTPSSYQSQATPEQEKILLSKRKVYFKIPVEKANSKVDITFWSMLVQVPYWLK